MSARSTLQRVLVVDIIDDGTQAVVETVHHTRMNVPLTIRHGKGAWPQIDEVWLISNQYGPWCFSALMSEGKPPVINADRENPIDLPTKLLDGLISLGLMREEGSDDDYDGHDYSDTDLTPNSADAINEGDEPVDPGDVDETEVIPSSVWLGTYNTQGASLGNKAVLGAMKRLLGSPGHILALQEMYNGQGGPGYRDPVAAYLEKQGYTVLRDETLPDQEWLWLCLETIRFDVLDQGHALLSERVSDTEGIARYAQWVRVRDHRSGQRFSVINVAFSPPARFAASYYNAQVAGTADLLDTLSEDGPVYLLGSMNADYRDSAVNAHANWPNQVFTAHDAAPNWDLLTLPTGLGTYGLPLADYVWQGPDDGEIGTVKEQRILRGFTTAHRPLLVRVQLKRKDTDIVR